MKFAAPALSVVALVAGCKKVAAPAPPPPRPIEVVAVVSLPSIEANLPRVIAYAEQVRPGEAAELRVELEKGIPPRAVDWQQPIHFLIVAPPAGAAESEPDLVVVAAVRDPAELARGLDGDHVVRTANGWAVVGPARSADATLAWATMVLPKLAPTRATAVAYPDAIRARWSAELRDELEEIGPAMAPMRNMVRVFVEETESIEAHVDLEASDLVAEIKLVPRAGGAVAAVFAAQKPSTFALFERLPLPSPHGTMAGHFTLGPATRHLRFFLVDLIASEVEPSAPTVAAALRPLLITFFATATGEYAGVTIIGSDAAVNTFGVGDAARTGAALERLVTAVQSLELPPGLRISIENTTHEGVTITKGALFFGDVPALTGAWATWDQIFGFTITDPDAAHLRETISRSRAKPEPPEAIAHALADARQRGDSVIQTFDVLPGEQTPFLLAFGVRGGAAYLHMRAPAAQIAGILTLVASQDDDD